MAMAQIVFLFSISISSFFLFILFYFISFLARYVCVCLCADLQKEMVMGICKKGAYNGFHYLGLMMGAQTKK